MKHKNRRVAITGIGIISCLGLNRDEVQTSLREGRSGVRFLPERKALGFQSALSGVVEGFDPKSVLDRKQRKTLPEYGLWAWSAVSQALEQAGIHPDSLTGDEKTGVVFGNDSSAVTAVEQVDMLRSAAIGTPLTFRDRLGSPMGANHVFFLKLILHSTNLICTKPRVWLPS